MKRFLTPSYNFVFDDKTGMFARWGRTKKDDPVVSLYGPEMLDISITRMCYNNCSYCYRSAGPDGKHMHLELYKHILDILPDTVCQIALGGGEPTLHPDFPEILRLTRDRGIVPNYTTNGSEIVDSELNKSRDRILEATKEYCGVVAVSLHHSMDKTTEAVRTLIDYGVKTNIHCVLSAESYPQVIEQLPAYIRGELHGLNAVIFLLYKPVGRAKRAALPTRQQFRDLVELYSGLPVKLGFDSCSVPFLIDNESINKISIEPCEAGRFSMFISETGWCSPCSFAETLYEHEFNVADLDKVGFLVQWLGLVEEVGEDLSCSNEKCKYNGDCLGTCYFLPEMRCDLL